MIAPDQPVRIIADDLTGALDVAAAFARPHDPACIVLDPTDIPRRRVLVISTESRDSTAANARLATARACDILNSMAGGAAALWFHKIDSVLRGHPFATTAAMAQQLAFTHCIVAPAFPAMGRITRQGLQLVRIDADWCPTAQSDIAAGLRAAGVHVASDPAPQAGRILAEVADASTQHDLDRAVNRHAGHHLLWVGTRGLAGALAGMTAPAPCPPPGLVIIGTLHPSTRAQVAAARALCDPVPDTGPIAPNPTACLLIDPASGTADAAATAMAVQLATRRIDPASLSGRSIFVSGGETLAIMLRALGTLSLDCPGEVAPGLPVAILRGGAGNGLCLITKSGGFGPPDLLRHLIMAAPQTRASRMQAKPGARNG